MRFPVWIYRLRLGFVFGKRFLLLTSTGRKSGLPRRVVLEVMRHDAITGSYVVASGRGEKSNWFRNIQERPDVKLTVGRNQFSAQAVRLSKQAPEAEFLDYGRRHPRAAGAMYSTIGATPRKLSRTSAAPWQRQSP